MHNENTQGSRTITDHSTSSHSSPSFVFTTEDRDDVFLLYIYVTIVSAMLVMPAWLSWGSVGIRLLKGGWLAAQTPGMPRYAQVRPDIDGHLNNWRRAECCADVPERRARRGHAAHTQMPRLTSKPHGSMPTSLSPPPTTLQAQPWLTRLCHTNELFRKSCPFIQDLLFASAPGLHNQMRV